MYIYLYIYIYMYIHIYIYTYIRIYTYIYIYIYTYIYIYIYDVCNLMHLEFVSFFVQFEYKVAHAAAYIDDDNYHDHLYTCICIDVYPCMKRYIWVYKEITI
jgi:hypothetical protein